MDLTVLVADWLEPVTEVIVVPEYETEMVKEANCLNAIVNMDKIYVHLSSGSSGLL